MVIITNYSIAIMFTVLAMICWGSWANTQKIAERSWRFEMFYWDKITGILVMALLAAFTLGSMGGEGRTFLADLAQADMQSLIFAMLGGVLWNAGNLFIVAAIATAGMSVAFPIGGGIAWILGILVNYVIVLMDGKIPASNPLLLWSGMVIIIVAIFLSGKAYKQLASEQKKAGTRGIVLSVVAGLFIAFFYGFLVKSLDGEFVAGGTGTLTPFTAIVAYAVGVWICTIPFYLFFMKPLRVGNPGTVKEYFSGSTRTHMAGWLGGMTHCSGTVFSFLAIGAASPAIAYGMSNAAPVVAIIWGVFVWREFRGAPGKTNILLSIMFLLYIVGLVLITWSNA
jgi:glucose uptake protein